MKCFEIQQLKEKMDLAIQINRKHEMFWNQALVIIVAALAAINRKHEMFWNLSIKIAYIPLTTALTVNMKCFEILMMKEN